MNMEIPLEQLEWLLIHLKDFHEIELEKGGFLSLSERVNDVTSRYLAENLCGGLERAKRNNESYVNLQLTKLDELTRSIKYKGWSDFVDYLKIDDRLLKLEGVYYLLFRKNSEQEIILQSPTKIERVNHYMQLTIRGRDRSFEGRLEIIGDCISCLLRSEKKDKTFHHIYKAGLAENAQTLQGIFSGVSSLAEPIGGRCLLIREIKNFAELDIGSFSIQDWKNSGNERQGQLARYFEEFGKNNLALENIRNYGLDG